jgi:hypothetical protein
LHTGLLVLREEEEVEDAHNLVLLHGIQDGDRTNGYDMLFIRESDGSAACEVTLGVYVPHVELHGTGNNWRVASKYSSWYDTFAFNVGIPHLATGMMKMP